MTRIKFNEVDINIIAKGSGINTGMNVLKHWKKRSSSDEGFGVVQGNHNNISKNLSISDRTNGESSNV